MHIDLFLLFELQATGAFSWVQLVRKLFLAALNCNSKWHLKRRAVILTSFMKHGFSHHIFPDNNTSIVLFIKSSSNQRHCLFSQDTIHSAKKPTAVCLFAAFYCRLLNLWGKYVIKSRNHSLGWKADRWNCCTIWSTYTFCSSVPSSLFFVVVHLQRSFMF